MNSLMSFQKSGMLFGLDRLCTLNHHFQITGPCVNILATDFEDTVFLRIFIPSLQVTNPNCVACYQMKINCVLYLLLTSLGLLI